MSLAELNTFLVWGTAAGDAPAFGAFAVDLARRTEVAAEHRPGPVLDIAASATTLGPALPLGGIVLRSSTLWTVVTDLLSEWG